MDLATVFALPSGVECEVAELTGKEQRLLTEQKHKKFTEKLEDVLVSVLKRVGNNHTISEEFVKTMLSEDRKAVLWKARMISVEEPTFNFGWDYVDQNDKKQTHPLAVDLTVDYQWKPYYKQWKEYDEIDRQVTTTLPKTQKVITFTLLDGVGERAGNATKKDERSSHTPILMRNPTELIEGTPVKVNLDKLPLKDIEHLRKAIKEHEGKVPTEVRFEHPDAEYKAQHEKDVVLDLLGQLAFFFPSEAI